MGLLVTAGILKDAKTYFCPSEIVDPQFTYQPNPDPMAPQVPAAEVVTSYTGNGGNPQLKPMEANQFDLAAEWYFAPQGSLYTTLFYKDLKNYFIRGVETQNLWGQDWQVNATINGDEGTIKGFEIGYSQFYDELPGWLRGLGMQANFTYVDSKGGSPTAGPSGDSASIPPGLPLEGLSRKSYNLVGMYQRGPVEARLAYNWRERWLLTTHDGDGKGAVWNADYGQLDASIFVRFNDHLQIGFEGNVGLFFGEDTDEGRPIKVVYRWTRLGPDYATWEQSFSYDDGKSWETNWKSEHVRVKR